MPPDGHRHQHPSKARQHHQHPANCKERRHQRMLKAVKEEKKQTKKQLRALRRDGNNSEAVHSITWSSGTANLFRKRNVHKGEEVDKVKEEPATETSGSTPRVSSAMTAILVLHLPLAERQQRIFSSPPTVPHPSHLTNLTGCQTPLLPLCPFQKEKSCLKKSNV